MPPKPRDAKNTDLPPNLYDAQDLMGHRDPETTRTYTDSRGSEWVDVKAA